MRCVVSFLCFFTVLTLSNAVYVSNLDIACLNCICTASTGCDSNYGCSQQGFCGPFFISRKYWEEGGKINRDEAYEDISHEPCAKDIQCASKVVANYMSKHGKDCDGDGVTDCDDYARVHFYGAVRCGNDIEKTSFYDRYLTCRPPKPQSLLLL